MTTNNLRFRVNDVRVAFPVLLKGEQFNGEGKFRCGAQLLVPPDHPDHAKIEAAILDAATAKWKDKAAAKLKGARAKDKVSYRDGDLKSYDGFAGNMILSANCAGGDTEPECKKPNVFDVNRVQITDPAKNPIYAGCYVSAMVEFYADDRFGDGVFCTLSGIQFRKDGDAFGAAKARADEFEPAAEGADAEEFA